jgi:hypothetical protein
MEIAPFEIFDMPPDQVPGRHNSYDLAAFLFAKIVGKSRKYRSARSPGLFLLLYLTDWRFLPGQTALALLQYWCNRRTHSFEAIFAFEGDGQGADWVKLIAPTPAGFWKGFDPEKFRDSSVVNLDPSKWYFADNRAKD